MSDRLGTIPFPQAQAEDPLAKYQRQLNPLAQITNQLFQRQSVPTQPAAEPSLARLGMQAATGQGGVPAGGIPHFPAPAQAQMSQEMLTGPGTQPQPLPEAPAGPPPGPLQGSAGLAALSPQEGPSTPLAGPTAAGTPAGALAEGGPTDVTQFAQDPGTGRIVRKAPTSASRMLRMLAPDVPEFGGQPSGAAALAGAGGQPTGAGGAGPPPANPARSRSEERISTRIPSEAAMRKAGDDVHTHAESTIGLPSMKEAKASWDKNAAMIKANYPGLQKLKTDDPDAIKEAFIQHGVDNLKALHKEMVQTHGEDIVERSGKWYEGANKIAHDLANEFNIHPRQAAAVLAALSPQKDWYQNVDLARRLLEIHRRQGNISLTKEMGDYADRYIAQLRKDKKDPDEIDRLEQLKEKFKTTPFQRLTDRHERAVWARWYDEANNPRSYRLVTPEGEFGGNVKIPLRQVYGKRGNLLRTTGGEDRRVTWGSFNEIAKAMAAMQTNDLPTISRLMGENHKVRNFYNNIIAHNHGHDVTIDTHAIAAALLRPLGASALEVGHGLGTSTKKGAPGASNNDTLGNKGLYGLYAEMYRRAARDLGLSPRQLQSITWEGIRGVFSPEQKRDEAFTKHIDSIWRGDAQYGKMTSDEKRRAIIDHAGGMRAPSWAGGEDYGDEE